MGRAARGLAGRGHRPARAAGRAEPAPRALPRAGRRGLFALKELPPRIARREYDALRGLEAAAPAGRPRDRAGRAAERRERRARHALPAPLVPVPPRSSCGSRRQRRQHRERLLRRDGRPARRAAPAAASYWGDCSLANTLFRRDGQRLQAFFVDAETSEVHPQLSDGQRRTTSSILVENVAGDLADLDAAAGARGRRGRAPSPQAESVGDALRAAVGRAAPRGDASRPGRAPRASSARIRRLNDLGFAVDEVTLEPAADGRDAAAPARGGRRPPVPRRAPARADRPRGRRGPGRDPAQRPARVPGRARARAPGRRPTRSAAAAGCASVLEPAAARPGGARRRRRPDPGLLRPARGPLAAQRAGRARRGRRGRARGAGRPARAARRRRPP